MNNIIVVTIFVLLFCAAIMVGIAKCSRTIVHEYGGKQTIILPPNKHLINISWKDGNLWYLTRDMAIGEIVQTYTFQENSAAGIFQGTIIIIETH
jgi:hypothetical protein